MATVQPVIRALARPSLFGIAFASTLLWAASALAQQPLTLRLGHVGFPGSLFDISANKLAKDVNEALKGKVEVRVFHSSQLGSDEAWISLRRSGWISWCDRERA